MIHSYKDTILISQFRCKIRKLVLDLQNSGCRCVLIEKEYELCGKTIWYNKLNSNKYRHYVLKYFKVLRSCRMIKNRDEIQKLENELVRIEKVDILKNFRLVDAMHKEAMMLNAFPVRDALAGIEVDIKIAKVINSVSKSS